MCIGFANIKELSYALNFVWGAINEHVWRRELCGVADWSWGSSRQHIGANQTTHHEDMYGGLDPLFLYLGVIMSQPLPTEWATEQRAAHGRTYLLQICRQWAWRFCYRLIITLQREDDHCVSFRLGVRLTDRQTDGRKRIACSFITWTQDTGSLSQDLIHLKKGSSVDVT